jgi:hypothetical protein
MALQDSPANGSPQARPPALGAPGPRAWWRGLPPRQRRILRSLFAVCVIVVLAVGVLLARFLSVENAERDDEQALVQAEVAGDEAGMLVQLDGCSYRWLSPVAKRLAASRACVAGVKADAADPHLRRKGAVKILQLESTTAYSLSGATGETRLAWTVIGTLPVVQCVEIRRTGSFLGGIHVQPIAISAPISGEGRCTKESTIEREEEEATAVEQGR